MENYKNKTTPKGFALPSLEEMIHSTVSSGDYKSSPMAKFSLYRTPKQGIERKMAFTASSNDIAASFHTPPQTASLMKNIPIPSGFSLSAMDKKTMEFSAQRLPNPISNPLTFPMAMKSPFSYNEDPTFNGHMQNRCNLNRSPLPIIQPQLTPETFYNHRDFQAWRMNPRIPLPKQSRPLNCSSIQHAIPHINHTIDSSSLLSLPQEHISPYQPNTRTILINCDRSLNLDKDTRIGEMPYQYVPDYGNRSALQNYYSPPVAPPSLSKHSSSFLNVFPLQNQLAPLSYANPNNYFPYLDQDIESASELRTKASKNHCHEKKVMDLHAQEIDKFKIKTRNKYPCSICKKPFNRFDALKTHMNMHLGLKPFRCGICAKRFNAKQNMLRHERNHTAK